MEREGILPQLDKYVAMVQEKNNEYFKVMNYTFSNPPVVEIAGGKKYARVALVDQLNGSRSVHTFVNLETGDILKSGGWKKPQKNGVRGNIFADDLGADRVNEHGANYIKGPRW